MLVVEPDEPTREAVVQALSSQVDQLQVRGVASARLAMEVLSRQPADVLITALDMPEMDGFELIAFAMAQRPEVSVVLIGDHDSGRLREILRSAESFYHLRRPVGPQQILQLLRSLRPASAAGHLQGLSLAGLLQMLGLEGKTCLVRVRSAGETGRVELAHGDIVHAECGTRRGREAAFEMLVWQAPELSIEPASESHAESMRVSVAELLIEAAWHLDETRRSRPRRSGDSGKWPSDPPF